MFGKFGDFIFSKVLDQVANLLVHRAMQVQTISRQMTDRELVRGFSLSKRVRNLDRDEK